MGTSIEPFLHRKVVVLREDTSVEIASRAMAEQEVGSIVVSTRDGELVGILTDRDVCCRLVAFGGDLSTPISEVMTDGLIAVDDTATLEDVIQVMADNGIRRVPVLRSGVHRQNCVGIITLDDLIAAQAIDTSFLRDIVEFQGVKRRTWRRQKRPGADQHKQQTLDRFYKSFAPFIQQDDESLAPIVSHLTKMLVQRMTVEGAHHLIPQLPVLIQQELYDVANGPDKTINRATILTSLIENFELGETEAEQLCAGYWRGLKNFVSPGEPDKILVQLPNEMKALFLGDSHSMQRSSEATLLDFESSPLHH